MPPSVSADHGPRPLRRTGADGNARAHGCTRARRRVVFHHSLLDRSCDAGTLGALRFIQGRRRRRPARHHGKSERPADRRARPTRPARRRENVRAGAGRTKSDYELFNCNNFNIRYRSWNYRGCWHQTCPPIDPGASLCIALIPNAGPRQRGPASLVLVTTSLAHSVRIG